MRTVIFLLIPSLFMLCSYSPKVNIVNYSANNQVFTLTDLQKMGIKGKVQIIEQSKYYVYYNDESKPDELAELTKTTFNDAGMISSMERYGSAHLLIFWEEYSYDKNGSLKKTMSYNQDSVIREKKINKYNHNGSLTKQLCYDKNGKYSTYRVFKTDEKGRVTEDEWFTAADDNPLLYFTKKYDDTGNLVELMQSIESGENGERYVYIYNSDNLQTGEDHYNEFGDLVESLRYEYVFDEKGNWVKRIITNKNILVFIEIREIVYY